MQSAISKLEAERAEVEGILSSGVLGRASNLARFLTYVCERYFEGAVDEIKEYTIAVQALGRPETFDPQVDTIVRVTAHALRKRLEDYYRTAGAEHPVQICLPPGHYVPKFVHKQETNIQELQIKVEANGVCAPLIEEATPGNGSLQTGRGNSFRSGTDSTQDRERDGAEDSASVRKSLISARAAKIAMLFLLAFTALSLLVWRRWKPTSTKDNGGRTLLAAAPPTATLGTIRALAASDVAAYIDRSGSTWQSDHFCSGGSTFSVTGHTIQGTVDQQLFSSGRRGIFHCQYPVPPGVYEVHLLFAETSGLQENSRNVVYSINGGPAENLDVVDDAGGDDIATTKVYTDVKPNSDGMIHINFTSPESFVNALQILPGTPHRMLPVRILAGQTPYTDGEGNVWLSDRYFSGGRMSLFGEDLSKLPNGGIYEGHRLGHFRYIIPVAPDEKYTLRLYFIERWFGAPNRGIGGVGSRIFDVSCNGTILLKDFDIYREAGSAPLIKTFAHIEPTAQGKIEIYFTPDVNYPSVSAIEVLPE